MEWLWARPKSRAHAELLLTAGSPDIFFADARRWSLRQIEAQPATAFAMNDLQLPEIGRCNFLIVGRIKRELKPSCVGMRKGNSMITVEAKKVGARVIATVKVGIGTGQYAYTVQFADQGSEAANEAEAQRELRKTLEEVLEALGPS